ncbi:MAG TPA: hypothetical protein VMW58_07215 [Anaerolineae bacterium]|nr:hypothetical protein [Anaerolineae bacterium]
MPDKPWKAFERRIAKSLGTERTPLSGIASKHTRSDTLHPILYVECKYRSRLAISDWYEQADDRALTEDKMPVLALQKRGHHITLAVLSWHNFLLLWDTYRRAKATYGQLPNPPILEEEK